MLNSKYLRGCLRVEENGSHLCCALVTPRWGITGKHVVQTIWNGFGKVIHKFSVALYLEFIWRRMCHAGLGVYRSEQEYNWLVANLLTCNSLKKSTGCVASIYFSLIFYSFVHLKCSICGCFLFVFVFAWTRLHEALAHNVNMGCTLILRNAFVWSGCIFLLFYLFSYCLPAAPQTSDCPDGFPGRRPGRRGWGRPWCPWWPGCRPSAPSRHPVCTCLSFHHTSASPRRYPSHQGRSCSPESDMYLDQEERRVGEWS